MGQARDTRYAIRQYVESDRRWADSSRSKVRFAHAVVTPFVGLGLDFDLPDCPRWMIHDRDDLDDLAARLADIPLGFETHCRVPTEDDCEVIVDILTARGTSAVPTVADEADERGYSFDRTRVVGGPDPALRMPLTDGQLHLEWEHLATKVRVRNPEWWAQVGDQKPRPHPLFVVEPGPVAVWERAV